MVIHGLWVLVAAFGIATLDLASNRWATAVHNEQLIDLKRLELEFKKHNQEVEDAQKFFKSWDTYYYRDGSELTLNGV